MMDWIALIQTLGGIFSGLGLGMFTKSGRIKMQAEAHAKTVEAYEMQLKSQREGYEARLVSAQKVNDERIKTEIENAKYISELNHALNDKTAYIRKIVADVYDSQQELNQAKDEITRLTKEVEELKRELDRLELIRCHRFDCDDRLPSELVEKLRNLPNRANLTAGN